MNKAKTILKEHGVNGFRKLKLKRVRYSAGKQCEWINPHVAVRLLDRLTAEGVVIESLALCRELASKGLLDCLTIRGSEAV